MVLCAFEMRGQVPTDVCGAAIEYEYADQAEPSRSEARPGAGRLYQGTLYASRTPLDSGAVTRHSNRTLLTGWVARSSLPGRAGDEHRLQRLLDTGGPAAVRRLRGDFVIAHLSPDRSTLRLYRGVTSMIPLFWRPTDDGLEWATDPLHLLSGNRPSPSDVAADLLPMIIAERGFPHDRSWFAGVYRLPAGACVTLRSGGRPAMEHFDTLTPVPDAPRTLAEAADGLRARLGRACERMLPAGDAAVLLLSGGTDSAAVAHDAGMVSGKVVGLHFTMASFPGFDQDRKAAEAVAAGCGLSFLPYDMRRHVAHGGDYLRGPANGSLPQTHVPLRGTEAAAAESEARDSTFVLSGILSDQILAHDWHRGLFDVMGWSILNPLVAGEPVWQILGRTVRTSFGGSTSPGLRGYLRYARELRAGDPTAALPHRDTIVHPVGFTDEAAARVTQALRTAADRAREQLRARRNRGIPLGTTSRFLINEVFNTPNLQAAILNHCLPRRCFFATPYADRDVIEYALALPNRFRLGSGYGATIDKFALRLAYAHTPAGRRMQQARIDAFPAMYVNQNFDRCQALLGKESRLCELGVVSDAFSRGMSRRSAHRNGEEIARLCVIEEWLRRIAA